MTISRRTLILGGTGLAAVLWMLLSLWTGAIYSKRGPATHRDTEPVQFYAWIFFYALLATIFIATGVYFFLHPEFSLAPTTHLSDD